MTTIIHSLSVGFALLVLNGCGSVVVPINPARFLNPHFEEYSPTKIEVLPIADWRQERDIDADLTQDVFCGLTSPLRGRGYDATYGGAVDSTTAISEDEIRSLTDESLARLSPSASRWILLVAARKVSRTVLLGTSAEAHLEGFLVDREKKEILWEGVGKASAQCGWMWSAQADDFAIQGAAAQLVLGLPMRPATPGNGDRKPSTSCPGLEALELAGGCALRIMQ